ncbi:hypothetical protein [Paraoerskovia marina]|uniref:hypothetical protein n=1 Tax=Paraoerskovia marina TaxID=545619 RepID=UPI000492A07C|nr:hypothetical protein [Paraoerskovia marina]
MPLRPDAIAVATPRGPAVPPTVGGAPGSVVGLPGATLVPLWHGDGRYTVHPFATPDDAARLAEVVGRGRLPRHVLPDGAVREIVGVRTDNAGTELLLSEVGDDVVRLGPALEEPPSDVHWPEYVSLMTAVLRDRLPRGERVVLTYGGWAGIDPRTYVAAAQETAEGVPALTVQAVPAPPAKDETWAKIRIRRLRLGVAQAPWDDDSPEGAAALMLAAISQWSAPWTAAITVLPVAGDQA